MSMAEISGYGAPNKNTVGAIGDIYTNLSDGKQYKCVNIFNFDIRGEENDYTEYEWSLIVEQGDTGADGVKSWDELEDRPFYTIPAHNGILLEETEVTIDTSDEPYAQITSDMKPFVEGETYTVTVNETQYECVAWLYPDDGSDYAGAVILGNGSIIYAEGSGEDVPFAIDSHSNDSWYLNTSESGTYTVSVTGLVPATDVPLDEKYIPDAVKAGIKVYGKTFTVDDVEVSANKGAEIFNDYENNIATGYMSHAEGSETVASEQTSHAEGLGSKASGYNSHAEGEYTIADGGDSHAEGHGTQASGLASHAEGYKTQASGSDSHAEGTFTVASGECSHAEGSETVASERTSHAEGNNTTASGLASHAEGYYTKVSGDYQHVQGKFNIEDTEGKYAHIVGNGSDGSNRSNAHTLDWDGNAWYAGDVESKSITLESSTDGSDKKFTVTVDDDGKLSGVTTSWNDLEDKPFYDEEVALVPETTVSFATMEDLYGLYGSLIDIYNTDKIPEEDDDIVDVKVMFGEDEYHYYSLAAIGNISIMEGDTYPDTGEPFVIFLASETQWAVIVNDTSITDKIISIEFTIVSKKLEERYIPDSVKYPNVIDLVSLGMPAIEVDNVVKYEYTEEDNSGVDAMHAKFNKIFERGNVFIKFSLTGTFTNFMTEAGSRAYDNSELVLNFTDIFSESSQQHMCSAFFEGYIIYFIFNPSLISATMKKLTFS